MPPVYQTAPTWVDFFWSATLAQACLSPKQSISWPAAHWSLQKPSHSTSSHSSPTPANPIPPLPSTSPIRTTVGWWSRHRLGWPNFLNDTAGDMNSKCHYCRLVRTMARSHFLIYALKTFKVTCLTCPEVPMLFLNTYDEENMHIHIRLANTSF